MNFILPSDDWSTLWFLESTFSDISYVNLQFERIFNMAAAAPKHSRVNRSRILIGQARPMEGVLFAGNLAKCSTDGKSISSVPATHPLFAIVPWLLLSFVFVSENSSGLSSSGVLLRIG